MFADRQTYRYSDRNTILQYHHQSNKYQHICPVVCKSTDCSLKSQSTTTTTTTTILWLSRFCPRLNGWVSTRKVKPIWIYWDSEWQWHQLGHMQICTSLQTSNHTSIPPLNQESFIGQRKHEIHWIRNSSSHKGMHTQYSCRQHTS